MSLLKMRIGKCKTRKQKLAMTIAVQDAKAPKSLCSFSWSSSSLYNLYGKRDITIGWTFWLSSVCIHSVISKKSKSKEMLRLVTCVTGSAQ